MKNKRFIGIFLIAVSLIILVSNVSITGAVIGAQISTSISFVALAFFLVGTLLFISERRQIESRIETLAKAGVVAAKIEAIQEGIKGHYKRMSKEERKAIYEEVADVIELVQSGKRVGGAYNLHKLSTVPPSLSGISKAI